MTTCNAHILHHLYLYFHEDTLNRAVTPTHPLYKLTVRIYSPLKCDNNLCRLCIYNANIMGKTIIFAIPLSEFESDQNLLLRVSHLQNINTGYSFYAPANTKFGTERIT